MTQTDRPNDNAAATEAAAIHSCDWDQSHIVRIVGGVADPSRGFAPTVIMTIHDHNPIVDLEFDVELIPNQAVEIGHQLVTSAESASWCAAIAATMSRSGMSPEEVEDVLGTISEQRDRFTDIENAIKADHLAGKHGDLEAGNIDVAVENVVDAANVLVDGLDGFSAPEEVQRRRAALQSKLADLDELKAGVD